MNKPGESHVVTVDGAFPDTVNHPKHYNSHPSGVECITIARHMNFNLGNVLKYIWRADHKGATLEDLKKARFYLDDEIAMRERQRDDVGADAERGRHADQ